MSEEIEFEHRRYSFLQGGVKSMQRWELDENGNPKKDKHGNKINKAGERHPSWNEALMDLSIVASFSVLDAYLDDKAGENESFTLLWSVFMYFLCFSPLFSHWQALDGYINRFGLEGVGGVFLVIVNLIGISACNLSLKAIGDNPNLALSNYMLCLVFLNFVIAGMNYRVFRLYHPDNVAYSLNCLIFHIFSAISWLILFFILSTPLFFYIGWTLMSVLNRYRIDIYIKIGVYISPIILDKSLINAPPPINVGLTAERFGLFIILAIGECIMGTVGAVVNFDTTTIIGLVLASLQGYLFKIAYFDLFDCIGEHAEVNAMRRSKENGIAYMYWHLPAVMGITLSSGLVLKVFNAHHAENAVSISFYQQLLYCCAFATALMSFWKIHKQHLPRHGDAKIMCIDENTSIHIVAFTMCCVSWTPISSPLLLQSVLLLLFLLGISIGAVMEWLEVRTQMNKKKKIT